MDTFTMKAALAIGVLLLIGFLWLIWKFFAKLFKHVIIVLLLSVAGSAFYYYRSLPPTPAPTPYVGKHAYMKENGEYIGVVESEGKDDRRGPVWIIRPVGGYPQKYAKSRVTLKDKMELKPESTPAPESKPASDKIDKNANKVDKKKKS